MKRTRNVCHLQIRKCKNMANILKKNTLLNACVNGKGDIFTEIRKLRRSSPPVVNAIDGVTEDLPNHFAKTYNTLYNSVNDTDSLTGSRANSHTNKNVIIYFTAQCLVFFPKHMVKYIKLTKALEKSILSELNEWIKQWSPCIAAKKVFMSIRFTNNEASALRQTKRWHACEACLCPIFLVWKPSLWVICVFCPERSSAAIFDKSSKLLRSLAAE